MYEIDQENTTVVLNRKDNSQIVIKVEDDTVTVTRVVNQKQTTFAGSIHTGAGGINSTPVARCLEAKM